jgi:hypothetical protein
VKEHDQTGNRHHFFSAGAYDLRVDVLGPTVGLVVMVGGFAAARAFRMKRYGDGVTRRIERKDLESRRHHFTGRADMELPQDESSSHH